MFKKVEKINLNRVLLICLIKYLFIFCFSFIAIFSLFSCKKPDVSEGVNIADEPAILTKEISLDPYAPYATFSVINEGKCTLYYHNEHLDEVKKSRKVVAVNAGHGTKGGSKQKTFSHPDFTPKVSGGTNAKGAVMSSAISDGTTLKDNIHESEINLKVAMLLKEKLLDGDYDVLMIRENDDQRLDNIARTVIANENADIHIAIHFDSTDTDKGIFYIAPTRYASYINMMPLKSNIENIERLGDCIITAFKEMGEKILGSNGIMRGDLTQLSFSTNASIDIELGDKKTDISDEHLAVFAKGIKLGIDRYFARY